MLPVRAVSIAEAVEDYTSMSVQVGVIELDAVDLAPVPRALMAATWNV